MARWNEWFTPRRSNNGNECVEALITDSAVYVRNSKRRDRGSVEFSHPEWRAFIMSVRECDDYTLPG